MIPTYSAEESRDREAFLALMWALSYPGRIRIMESVPDTHAAFRRVGTALLDLETSFFTPDAVLADELARSGARALPPAQAAYHFYPTLDASALESIAHANAGTQLRPDEAATLVIGCALASGGVFQWSGPGIQGVQEVRLGGIQARFWLLRGRALRYPLGWDVFFIDHGQVIGLPRTTRVG